MLLSPNLLRNQRLHPDLNERLLTQGARIPAGMITSVVFKQLIIQEIDLNLLSQLITINYLIN